MMKRILKRPMFKMGGDVENVGIMDGMRNRYQEPMNAPVGSPRDERLQRRLQMISCINTKQPNIPSIFNRLWFKLSIRTTKR